MLSQDKFGVAIGSGESVDADPYWDNVVLLVHGDGANGSTTITDSKGLNTLTAVGGVALSTAQSKFGGSSIYFDASGDYLTTINAGFAVGTGDFTIEGWVYFTNTTNRKVFQLAATHLSTSVATILLGTTSSVWEIYTNGTAPTGGSVSANTWYHVAYVKSGGTTRLYVDGVQTIQAADTTNYAHTYLTIGGGYSTSYLMSGYIDEFRFTNGIARYIANFTPPTKAFPSIKDYSYDPYYYTNTALLVHADGTDGSTTIIDTTGRNSLTANGNAHIEVDQFKYGGSSLYFDGSGDYVTVPSSANNSLGGGDYTVEFWAYQTAAGTQRLLTQGTLAVGSFLLIAYANGSADWCQASTPVVTLTAAAIQVGSWFHFAATRSGTSVKCFINGVQVGNTGVSSYVHSDTSAVYIGKDPNTASQDFNGYIDDLRITKGACRYTTNFTPPPKALPDTGLTYDPYFSNVSLLVHGDGTNGSTTIVDSTGKNTLTALDGAIISTAQNKFGGSSLYFDGSSRISSTDIANANFGTGDFTLEMWAYPLNTLGFCFSTRPENSDGYFLGINTGNLAVRRGTGGGVDLYGGTVVANQWQHFAVSRQSGVTRLFLNGIQVATAADTYNWNTPSSTYSVGTPYVNSYTYPFYGYLDDLRITKGVARYTANFIPPNQAFYNN